MSDRETAHLALAVLFFVLALCSRNDAARYCNVTCCAVWAATI